MAGAYQVPATPVSTPCLPRSCSPSSRRLAPAPPPSLGPAEHPWRRQVHRHVVVQLPLAGAPPPGSLPPSTRPPPRLPPLTAPWCPHLPPFFHLRLAPALRADAAAAPRQRRLPGRVPPARARRVQHELRGIAALLRRQRPRPVLRQGDPLPLSSLSLLSLLSLRSLSPFTLSTHRLLSIHRSSATCCSTSACCRATCTRCSSTGSGSNPTPR